MPINNQHPDVSGNMTQWNACYDCYKGNRQVKSKGEMYLPKLTTGQEDAEYQSYLARALFYEATGRTVAGLVGAALWREPSVDLSDRLQGMVNTTAIRTFIRELLLTGRYGVLVDLNDKGDPKLAAYTAPNIINYHETAPNVFDLVVLQENVRQWKPTDKDPYTFENTVQYRELYLDGSENPEAPVYRQRIWVKDDKGNYSALEPITPLKEGAPLQSIPFIICNTEAISTEITPPPVGGIVDCNLWHYKIYADYSHGLHWTALPTPVFIGLSAEDTVKIGSGAGVKLPEGGDAKYLEFEGRGLDEVRTALETCENHMATLGARLLDNTKKAAEAAETVRLRQSAEISCLSTIVGTVESVLRAAIKIGAEWIGVTIDPEAAIKLQRDFVSQRITAQEITALVQAVQAGYMTTETFIEELRKGEVGSNTVEDELDKLDSQKPVLTGSPLQLVKQ